MTTDNDRDDEQLIVVRFLECYAGIGGWRMALEQAVTALTAQGSKRDHVRLECAAALDHSDLCVSVYDHNFSHHREDVSSSNHPTPNVGKRRRLKDRLKTFDLEQLTAEQIKVQFQSPNAWFLSPPCQPHTRQHSNQAQEASDPRSRSFAHLCDLLEHELIESSLPRLLGLENVVHFEKSASCRRLLRLLDARGYHIAEFHLTPTQVGLPNDRPRYFCLAIRPPEQLSKTTNKNPLLDAYFRAPSSFAQQSDGNESDSNNQPAEARTIHTSVPELGIAKEGHEECLPLNAFLDDDPTTTSGLEALRVPPKVLERNAAWCFDIVTPQSTRSACFTSSYGKFVRGTGSILYMGSDHMTPSSDGNKDSPDAAVAAVLHELQAPQDRTFDNNAWQSSIDPSKLRYFSGTEMARLFGFDGSFEFPKQTSLKQKWKLVGNSLNSRLAARLIQLGIQAAGGLNTLFSGKHDDSSCLSDTIDKFITSLRMSQEP